MKLAVSNLWALSLAAALASATAHAEISDYEKNVLHIYSTYAYEALNNEIRNVIWFEGFPGERIPVVAGLGAMDAPEYKLWHQLNGVLESLPPYLGKVYRGVGKRGGDWIAKTYRPGAVVRETAFTSSATDEKVALNFGPVVIEMQSLSGRDVSAFSYNPAEKEVLFGSGRVFQVTRVVSGKNGKIARVLLQELDESKLSPAQKKLLQKTDMDQQLALMQAMGYMNGRANLMSHARQAKDVIDAMKADGSLDAQDLKLEMFQAGG